jgi:hypothetical protein
MQQAKKRHGLLGTTQGNQVLLDPHGKYLEDINRQGRQRRRDGILAISGVL